MMLAGTGSGRTRSTSEVIVLWPGSPPGQAPEARPERTNAKGAVAGVMQPRLVVYRPVRPNGMAMIVIAGGGYNHIERGRESTPSCRWLQSAGITAFELIYRLPGSGWLPVAPFQDAQRAVRLVRKQAAAFAVDPARIGLIGFSAGAHLAGMTATCPAAMLYPPHDEADQLSARPDFAGLIYPVLTMMPPFDQTHARRAILGSHPDLRQSEAWSVERRVDKQTPPVFLAQAADDPVSPVDNSLLMFGALRAAGIPAEMHVFQSGGHGWGLGRPNTTVHAWPDLFIRWAGC